METNTLKREKKKREKRGELTAMRMSKPLLAALDTYCGAHRLRPSRTSVIEAAVREFLEKEGALPESVSQP